MVRVVRSDTESLLRQWWNEPVDYSWLVEFFRRRDLLTGLKAMVSAGGLLLGFAMLCLLYEDLAQPRIVSRIAVIVMATVFFGGAIHSWLSPWPSVRRTAVWVVIDDIFIAVAAALHANPMTAIATTPLFALIGLLIVLFFGPRVLAAHAAFVTATILALATWVALSHHANAVPVAISKTVVLLTVAVGIFPPLQFGFWLIRNNSVESLTDPLTGLANRRGLSHRLARSIDSVPLSTEPLCALLIDLDHFKQINDDYGHNTGDAVIALTADRIRHAARPSAFVARTGGEEFVVIDLLPLDAASAMAERIRVAIEALDAPRATASVGVAAGFVASVSDFDAINVRADDAMYVAKRLGGNRVATDGQDEPAEPSGAEDVR